MQVLFFYTCSVFLTGWQRYADSPEGRSIGQPPLPVHPRPERGGTLHVFPVLLHHVIPQKGLNTALNSLLYSHFHILLSQECLNLQWHDLISPQACSCIFCADLMTYFQGWIIPQCSCSKRPTVFVLTKYGVVELSVNVYNNRLVIYEMQKRYCII